MLVELYLLGASVLIFFGILVGKVGFKFGIPALLLFLFTGMLFGVDGVGIEFYDMKLAQYVGMVALAIILFTGGMSTKIEQVRPILGEGFILSTLGVALTTLITGCCIYLVTNNFFASVTFSFPMSLLLAATMSSTDSASVFAILRSQNIQLSENLKPALELESGSNDPMAYMITIVLISYINGGNGNVSIWNVVVSFLLQFSVGVVFGYLMGKISVWILNKLNIHNDELYPITLLCLAITTYCITALLKGNGYLAVYIAGLVVGNSRIVKQRTVRAFFDGITWLLQIVLFILLGLLVNPREMMYIAGPALIVSLLMMFVARPLAVFISLIPFKKLSFAARVFVSWVGLRGAAPILFATYPAVHGVSGAEQIFNIVFFVTLLSLIFQGMTIKSLALKLGLATPAPPEGFFVGVEIPEETGTKIEERPVTAEMLIHGSLLKDLKLKQEELVILVHRDNNYIVPKGNVELQPLDVLLIVYPEDLSVSNTKESAPKDLKSRLRQFYRFSFKFPKHTHKP